MDFVMFFLMGWLLILAFPKRRGKVDCAKNERKTDRGLIFDNYFLSLFIKK